MAEQYKLSEGQWKRIALLLPRQGERSGLDGLGQSPVHEWLPVGAAFWRALVRFAGAL